MLSEEANSFFLAATAALLVGAAAVAGAPSASKLMIRAVTARMYFPRAPRSPRGRAREMRHWAWRFCGAAQKGRAGNDSKARWFWLANIARSANQTIRRSHAFCTSNGGRRGAGIVRQRWFCLCSGGTWHLRWPFGLL